MEFICRTLRLKHGVLLRELAAAAGISKQHISRMELDADYQTPGGEALLQAAFESVARQKQEQASALLAEVTASRGRLFHQKEESEL